MLRAEGRAAVAGRADEALKRTDRRAALPISPGRLASSVPADAAQQALEAGIRV